MFPRLDILMSHKLARLGENIARNPCNYLGFALILSALFSTGLQRFYYESSPDYLFVPSNARAFKEQEVVDKLFQNKMDRYIIGAESSYPMVTEIAIVSSSLSEQNVLNKQIWKEARTLVQAVHKIQVTYEDDVYMWKNLCARFDGRCISNDFLEMYDRLDSTNLTYPIMKDPQNNKMYPLLAHVGGITLSSDNNLLAAQALKISFILDKSSEKKIKVGHIFTQVVRKYATSIKFKYIKVYSVTDTTLEEELSSVIDGSISKIPITIVLVLSFSVYNCLSTDWVRSKPLVGVASVFISVIAFSSAAGLALYLAIPWQAINIISLSLTLGIGLDDCFVMLSSWWRSESSCGRDVVSRLSYTYGDAAVSITVTSVTNIVSFLVGAAIPGFPAVRIFCFYSGLCMLFMYLWTLLMLGPCLTWTGLLEHENRHCLFFLRVDSKSESENSRHWFYTVMLQGGVGRKDSQNPRDNKQGKMMLLFRDVVAPILNRPFNKVIILLCFLLYLSFSIYGILQLEEGLERNKLVGHHSYAMKFYDTEDKYFRENPYRFQIIIEEPLDYWNETVRNSVFELIHKLEDSEFIISSPEYRQSWLHIFMQKVEDNFLFFDISSQKKFVDNVREFLKVVEDTPLSDDVIFSEDNSTIIASRFFLQSSKIRDAREEVLLLHELRNIIDSAPFRAIIYHPFFAFFDQFSQVTRTTVECVCLCCVCMTVITIIFIPDKRSIVWVTFTIISVELGIVGFMSIAGIRLDVISMIVIIMGIGFSVDFSAHISYHYLTSGTDLTANERVAHCLFALGPPIIRGGLSTILGVVSLYFHPSYITETFATMIFLIICLGVLHSILLLPVLLSLFGPGIKTTKIDRQVSSPSTLSETFTYQASFTPHPLKKKKEESLRKLVLNTGIKQLNGMKGMDRSDSSITSWYSSHQTPNFTDFLINRVLTDKDKDRDGEDEEVDAKWDKSQSDGDAKWDKSQPLPYYKFAHVKRSVRPNIRSPVNSEDKSEEW